MKKNRLIWVFGFVLFSLLFVQILNFAKSISIQKEVPEFVGVVNNKYLRNCIIGHKCISSFDHDKDHFYSPIKNQNIEMIWKRLKAVLSKMEFQIHQELDSGYIHATAKSERFGFVFIDDIEFLLSADEGKIYVRSESRGTFNFFNDNLKRMDRIRSSLLDPE